MKRYERLKSISSMSSQPLVEKDTKMNTRTWWRWVSINPSLYCTFNAIEQENKRLGSWLQNKLKEEEEKAATGADPNKNSVKVELDSTPAAMMTLISILYLGGVGVAHKNSSTERHQEISNGYMERLQYIGSQVQVRLIADQLEHLQTGWTKWHSLCFCFHHKIIKSLSLIGMPEGFKGLNIYLKEVSWS